MRAKLLCARTHAAEVVHTPMPAEQIAAGRPAAWSFGSWLLVCEVAKYEGLHTF